MGRFRTLMTAESLLNCYYCDKIVAADPAYVTVPAAYDLASEAPRCPRHWRYICGNCGKPSHFMATAICSQSGRLFCSACATDVREVTDRFWAWKYYFNFRSPWSGEWSPSLDRLEYDGSHHANGMETSSLAGPMISEEPYLIRYPPANVQWRPMGAFSDAQVQANWNSNAEKWDAAYDDDGDRNRRYQSDEPMLGLLGDVKGLHVLDVGSGNGYLCRKLAHSGALVTGIELSDRLLKIALEREATERLGIAYHLASASQMEVLPDSHFDKAVSNYVLMDIAEYETALQEVFRVLKPRGTFVAVLSHPCFASGPAGWVKPAPDSPRMEDRTSWRSDLYFHRGPYLGRWGGLNPALSFHRPLRDYWQAFREKGFLVEGFEEPSITDRGKRELPPSRVEQSLRVPYSCIFKLMKPA